MNEPIVRVRNLTRRFGNFTAVDNVSFDVSESEIFGYLGANGAGKSTTIRILCGLQAASEGEAGVAGIDIMRHPQAIHQAIGYMSQKFSLYLDLTVRENLAFFGGAYGLFGRAFRSRRDAVLHELKLDMLADQITASLAGGLRQRVALACAILHEPKVLFLDEPTAGVAPDARRMFWRLIGRLAAGGTTIFVTTHYMDEAEYCDRVGLMVSGRLAALNTPANLKRKFVPGRMLEVHGGDAAEVRNAASALPLLSIEPFGAALHVRVADKGPQAQELEAELKRHGLSDASVAATEVTLEDVFLRVVHDSSSITQNTENADD